MSIHNNILAKSKEKGGTALSYHLHEVSQLAILVAEHLGLDTVIAYKGALLHDIGKTSPLFQQTLDRTYCRKPGFVFRHEIASLFFLPLLREEEVYPVIDMIVAHHKSIYHDARNKGLIDLINIDSMCFEKHIEGFEQWSITALDILNEMGFKNIRPISIKDAEDCFWKVVEYCESKRYGYSLWKGVLIAADHLASALENKTEYLTNRLFVKPDISFYQSRKSELYPLSDISIDDERLHTLVTAPTGAGKTDFLIRRCKGRIFYTLPFQASINAMYERIKTDLADTNADVRLLHAASSLSIGKEKIEEKILQRHIGASIKILTPHQLASLAFGTKGYEALIADITDCDVILDEIHTYSDTIQAIVLKVVEVLHSLGCRIHIGTATMPSVLYDSLLTLFGGEKNVYEVKLPDAELDTFNRHIIHKADTIDSLESVIQKGIEEKQKILFVCNQVKRAQNLYTYLSDRYPDTSRMLIHSRFKREARNNLENELRNIYNKSSNACLVVSTQVVEVSLDISFDLMITECAPLDALIQRFGRINRKRTEQTIGKYKPVYVLRPPTGEKEALPYSEDILNCTFTILSDGELLKEKDIQRMIDEVYPEMRTINIDMNTVFNDGRWLIKELWHYPKSALLEILDIDSIACIDENDRALYEQSSYETQTKMEIPTSYKSVGYRKLDQSSVGSKPFILPSKAYNNELGLLIDYAKQEFYDKESQFL